MRRRSEKGRRDGNVVRLDWQSEEKTDQRPLVLHVIKPFVVLFDNARVHGAQPIVHHMAEGVKFTSGRVVLDTEFFGQRGFESMVQMRDAFEQYGKCEITYLTGDTDGVYREAAE